VLVPVIAPLASPTTYGQLRIATVKDPEGNRIQLLQPIAAPSGQ
jgi:predicted enzyme related to lactoylglutathione lyase